MVQRTLTTEYQVLPTIDKVLEWKNLQVAWRQVESNKGAPGVDEVSVARWGRNWETNLHRLRQQVKSNTYCPSRPRRFTVLKNDGGFRELSILTVTDRVLQRATLNALEPLFERRFLNCSFGYRPNRSVAHAVTTVVRQRERGQRWVLDADIRQCFESLDHQLIMELMRQEVKDAGLLRLNALWLETGKAQNPKVQNPKTQNPKRQISSSDDGDHQPSATRSGHPPRGVPLGAVLSPLWCNLVLHELDAALTRAGWILARYADDFVVLAETEGRALTAWEETEYALDGLGLQLNEAKTRVASFDDGFTFLGVTFKGDEYSYIHEQKRIRVKGPTVKILHSYLPDFY
ncbi:MAG: hypothetical protein HYZ49_14330 [Chloroflexi bacterium]|nr:hypothetical protein [Chloroflexota bacterium]